MAAKSKSEQGKIGVFHMLRDVLVASINKGQFPLAILGLILIIILVRMPPESLVSVLQSVVNKLEGGALLGWMLFIFVSAAWVIVSFRGRRSSQKEIQRIGKEKSSLQQQILGTDAPSSQS